MTLPILEMSHKQNHITCDFWDCLASFSIMFLRFIYIAAYILVLHLFYAWMLLCCIIWKYMFHGSILNEWTSGFFLLLAIVNSAAMNIHVQLLFESLFSILPRNVTGGLYRNSMFSFFAKLPNFSRAATPLCIPTSNLQGTLVSPHSDQCLLCTF